MTEGEGPLADLLRLAEWGPRQLVTAINSRLSSQGRDRLRLDPTAGYSWVRRGFRPRPPIPGVAAAVLTERLGYTVTADELWPGRPESRGRARTAAGGLDGAADVDGLLREVYLVPAARGIGAGRALLCWLECHAAAAGAQRAILETGVRNTAALRLFTMAGYEPVERYVAGRDPEINRAFARTLDDDASDLVHEN